MRSTNGGCRDEGRRIRPKKNISIGDLHPHRVFQGEKQETWIFTKVDLIHDYWEFEFYEVTDFLSKYIGYRWTVEMNLL